MSGRSISPLRDEVVDSGVVAVVVVVSDVSESFERNVREVYTSIRGCGRLGCRSCCRCCLGCSRSRCGCRSCCGCGCGCGCCRCSCRSCRSCRSRSRGCRCRRGCGGGCRLRCRFAIRCARGCALGCCHLGCIGFGRRFARPACHARRLSRRGRLGGRCGFRSCVRRLRRYCEIVRHFRFGCFLAATREYKSCQQCHTYYDKEKLLQGTSSVYTKQLFLL